jgi:hypothetical protein
LALNRTKTVRTEPARVQVVCHVLRHRPIGRQDERLEKIVNLLSFR